MQKAFLRLFLIVINTHSSQVRPVRFAATGKGYHVIRGLCLVLASGNAARILADDLDVVLGVLVSAPVGTPAFPVTLAFRLSRLRTSLYHTVTSPELPIGLFSVLTISGVRSLMYLFCMGLKCSHAIPGINVPHVRQDILLQLLTGNGSMMSVYQECFR